MSPRVLVLRAPGTNCDRETAYAFELAGAQADAVHLNRLLENPKLADAYQILCIPGGFSYGDDICAGRIFGNQMRHHLYDTLQAFKAAGKLLLGICNGFQVLMKSGVLLPDTAALPLATLTLNQSGKYEDRWVNLQTRGSKSVFLAGIEQMYLPVAHAEGQFCANNSATLSALGEQQQLCLRYTALDITSSTPATIEAPVPYPANPNGAQQNVAGICDDTGRVLGLMPHPERHIDPTHHPRWTRQASLPAAGDGLALFVNAVRYFG